MHAIHRDPVQHLDPIQQMVRDMSRSARTDTLMNSSRRPITLLAWLVGLTLTVAAGVGTSAAQGTGPSVEKVAQPGQDESLILRHGQAA